MEACDGLLGTGDAGLLTGDDAHVVHGGIKQLVVGSGSADTHVHDDLLQTRNVVDVGDAQLAFQLSDDLVLVLLFETRSSHAISFR